MRVGFAKIALVAVLISLCIYSTAANSEPQYRQTQRALPEKSLIGTWALEKIYEENEFGQDVDTIGDDPKGQLTFDGSGRFSLQIIGQGVKFRSHSRLRGTPLENQASVQETLSYYGSYQLNETQDIIMLRVERCNFPNWNASTRMASVSFEGDKLILTSVARNSLTEAWYSYAAWKPVR